MARPGGPQAGPGSGAATGAGRVQAKFLELTARAAEALRLVAAQLASHDRKSIDEQRQKQSERQRDQERQLAQPVGTGDSGFLSQKTILICVKKPS